MGNVGKTFDSHNAPLHPGVKLADLNLFTLLYAHVVRNCSLYLVADCPSL